VDALTTRGRTVRLIVTALCFGLLLVGTVWGDDDHFPFGPFRMYATNEGPNAPAADTRVEAVTGDGRVIQLDERNSGVRRAEIEGQQGLYVSNPARLAEIAEAYHRVNPAAVPLVEVRIVVRWHGIHHSRPTGTYTDETIADWRPA
jgi:hypothetical protein